MSTALLALQVQVLSAVAAVTERLRPPHRSRDGGQSTAEYALVLLGAATVALVFLAWAGRTSRIGKLFDSVLDTVIGKV